MSYLYIVPHWFFGFDIAMELVFAIIALVLAASAYKIYRASEQNEIKLFSVSFLLISLSYFVWAGINYFLLNTVSGGEMEISLTNLISVNYIFTLLHMGLFVAGLITLAYATLQLNDGRAFYLPLGLGLVALVSSSLPWVTYQIISIFLISLMVYHYVVDHASYKNKKARWFLFAFVLLLLSRIDFLFTIRSPVAYIFGHLFELGAYILILISLLSSIRVIKR